MVARTDRRMPLDPEPRADGNVVETGRHLANGSPLVEVLRPGDPRPQAVPLYVSHFSTCLDAANRRRKR